MSVSSDSPLVEPPPTDADHRFRGPRSATGLAAARIEPTDGELLTLFTRRDDRAALDRLVDRHAAMVWRVCRQALRRPQDAEDAFQATFLLLIKSARSIHSSESAAGWLYRVAYRTSIRARKKLAARREESLAVDPDAPGEDAFPDLLRKQTTGVLVEELMRLPAKYQTPLVLRYLEGQSRRAIADQTDTTVAAVQGRLARGKQMLRRRLLRRGVSLSAAMAAIGLAGRGARAAETAPAQVVAQTTTNGVALATGGSLAASAAVVSLYQEGVRAMFLMWIAKPAGVAASCAALALLAMAPSAGGEAPAVTPIGTLQLAVDLPSEPEASASGVKLAQAPTASRRRQSSVEQPVGPPPTDVGGSPVSANARWSPGDEDSVERLTEHRERLKVAIESLMPPGSGPSQLTSQQAGDLLRAYQALGERIAQLQAPQAYVDSVIRALDGQPPANSTYSQTVTAPLGDTGIVKMTPSRGAQITATTTPQPDGSAELRVQVSQSEPAGITLRAPGPDGPQVSYTRRNREYGWSVNQLQERLNEVLDPSPGLRSDGDYGPLTTRAVERFQKQHGLPETGFADAATRRKLGFSEPRTSGPGPMPKVSATLPARDATNVDPNLKEVRITFDRDMGVGGYSFTGNADTGMPTVPQGAKPKWIDKRTVVLPVRLEPGRAYRIGINSPSHKNFKSADGIPAHIDALQFTTASEQYQYGPDSKMKQGQWNCLHRPTELNPTGWATVAELVVGEHAPIKLPDDARPRPHVRLDAVEGEKMVFTIVDPGFPGDGKTWDASRVRKIRGVTVEAFMLGGGEREGSHLLVVRKRASGFVPDSPPTRGDAERLLREGSQQASRRRESSVEPASDPPPTDVGGSPPDVVENEAQPVAKVSATRIDYTDNKADGKKSLGGSGHLIRFELPEGAAGVKSVRIHGSRYGTKTAPREDFEISFLSEDRSEILAVERAAYGLFRRGKEKWTTVRFKSPVADLPEAFWVAIDFAPGRTKGVYLSYDTSTKGERSMTGLAQQEPDEHKPVTFDGDWMVSLVLERGAPTASRRRESSDDLAERTPPTDVGGSQNDDELNALQSRAWNLFFARQEATAEKLFRRVLEADPDRLAAVNGLGFCLLNQGNAAEAKPLFEKFLAENPEAAGPLNGLARCLEAEGDLDGAIGVWERSIAKIPNTLSDPVYSLARAYSERKQWEKALAYLEQITAEHPDAEPYADLLKVARRASNPGPPKPLNGEGVYVVGTYSGADGGPLTVEVPATEEPITLLMCAYYWQDWKLKLDPEAKLERVIVAGYNGQRLDGVIEALPAGVPLDVFSYYETKLARNDTPRPESFKDREYFWAYKKTSEEYFDLADKVRELTGKEIAQFQGANRADSFVVGRD